MICGAVDCQGYLTIRRAENATAPKHVNKITIRMASHSRTRIGWNLHSLYVVASRVIGICFSPTVVEIEKGAQDKIGTSFRGSHNSQQDQSFACSEASLCLCLAPLVDDPRLGFWTKQPAASSQQPAASSQTPAVRYLYINPSLRTGFLPRWSCLCSKTNPSKTF
jgi:hypothetical protein